MQIELKKIKIKDLCNGYIDKQDEGIVGYGGRLNIRPSYQREFVYQDKQRDEVVKTVKKGFPLNSIYWIKSGVDENDNDTYELMDGQQRTISICSYINGDYSIDFQYFFNLTKQEQDDILNYDLMVYFCEGNDKEKLDWFKTINIAGEKLTNQELRNAIYTGPWLSDAKRYFSKNQCVAYNMASDYVKGKPIRQEYLETTIAWIANKENVSIEEYMAKHQFDTNANPLWLYFN